MTIIWNVASTLDHEVTIDEGYEKLSPHYTDKEFILLLDSVRRHGQIVPGIVNKDYVILDGHHRHKACKEVGIPFIYEKMTSRFENREQELDFILDVNMDRCHMNEARQAM